MYYGDAIDELLSRLKIKDKTNKEKRAIAGLKLNMTYKEICNNSLVDWKPLIRNANILTVPNYTTGLVSITKYTGTNRLLASTVTGSGTTWTDKMLGRYFQHENTSQWYMIIKVVSTTEMVLDQPIVEASNSGLTYGIWKRFYYFPSNVEKLLDFGRWTGNGIIQETGLKYLRDRTNNIAQSGTASEYVMNGMYDFDTSYTTGKVALTEDSNVMTGVGTLWMDNVENGDLVIVSDNEYHVKRVESDTRIILTNAAEDAVSSSADYSIAPFFKVGFELHNSPSAQEILPYVFSKRVFDLVNEDKDRFDVPEKFEKAILNGAESMYLSDQDDSKYASKHNLYVGNINDLKRTDMYSRPRKKVFRPTNCERGGYI